MIGELIAALFYSAQLLVTTYQKDLTNKNVHPLFIGAIPNIFGHPVLAIIAALTVGIAFPKNPFFYLTFVSVGIAALIKFYFWMKGYTSSTFSACTAIASSSVLFTSLGAVIFLHESLSFIQWIALVCGTLGLLIITFPTKSELGKIRIEKGLLLIFIGVLFGAAEQLLYRYSATLVSEYGTFLIGRLVVDYAVYGFVILALVPLLSRTSTKQNFVHFFSQPKSVRFLILNIIVTLVGSYLFFILPLSTFAVIGTMIIPLSFIFGKIKYQEQPRLRIYLGATIVFASILLFLLNAV